MLPAQVVRVQFLFGELRSHMLHRVTKKIKRARKTSISCTSLDKFPPRLLSSCVKVGVLILAWPFSWFWLLWESSRKVFVECIWNGKEPSQSKSWWSTTNKYLPSTMLDHLLVLCNIIFTAALRQVRNRGSEGKVFCSRPWWIVRVSGMHAPSLSQVQLFCDPMDCSPPGSSVHGIFQARILEWVAISFSRGTSPPRAWTWVSCIGRQVLYHWATREVRVSWLGFRAILHVTKAQVLDCFVLFTVIIPEVFFNSSYFLHQIVINQNSLVAGKKNVSLYCIHWKFNVLSHDSAKSNNSWWHNVMIVTE